MFYQGKWIFLNKDEIFLNKDVIFLNYDVIIEGVQKKCISINWIFSKIPTNIVIKRCTFSVFPVESSR